MSAGEQLLRDANEAMAAVRAGRPRYLSVAAAERALRGGLPSNHRPATGIPGWEEWSLAPGQLPPGAETTDGPPIDEMAACACVEETEKKWWAGHCWKEEADGTIVAFNPMISCTPHWSGDCYCVRMCSGGKNNGAFGSMVSREAYGCGDAPIPPVADSGPAAADWWSELQGLGESAEEGWRDFTAWMNEIDPLVGMTIDRGWRYNKHDCFEAALLGGEDWDVWCRKVPNDEYRAMCWAVGPEPEEARFGYCRARFPR